MPWTQWAILFTLLTAKDEVTYCQHEMLKGFLYGLRCAVLIPSMSLISLAYAVIFMLFFWCLLLWPLLTAHGHVASGA